MKNTDWFLAQKWGAFTHYLNGCQNNPAHPGNLNAGETSWDECTKALDVERMAESLKAAGAHYLVFTLMQGSRHMAAPNATYDAITGYKPGEACCKRDLVGELMEALEARGLSLFLYYTGDGPHKDPQAGPAMGYDTQCGPLTDTFLRNWASVAKEYSLRYGKGVKGWWVDGCYEDFHYNDDKLAFYVPAMRAGNPDSLLAFNGGVKERVSYYSKHDDYTCGEMNSFVDLPDERFLNGAQWHTLAPLGKSPDGGLWNGWCRPGCQHDAAHMDKYVREVNARGGVVTIDIILNRDGSFDPEQMKLFSQIKA